MKTSTIVERDYSYLAAGKVWTVPELRLVRLPDGTIAVSADEIQRVSRAIANEICGAAEPLTAEELEFLCGTCAVSYSEVGDAVGVHRSALTRWRKASSTVRATTSQALKKWFWFQLFGSDLGDGTIPLSAARDDAALLRVAHDRALQSNTVSLVQERRAAG